MNQNIIIESEHKFIIDLNKQLSNDNIQIIKSKYKYNNIDFVIINEENLKHLYIELKERDIKFKDKYNSIIVNQCKITAIDKNYKKSIFIFKYGNIYKFIKYNKKIFNNFNTSFIKNQKVINIPNSNLETGDITALKDFINKYIN